jgi:hypothetical protein
VSVETAVTQVHARQPRRAGPTMPSKWYGGQVETTQAEHNLQQPFSSCLIRLHRPGAGEMTHCCGFPPDSNRTVTEAENENRLVGQG